MAGSQGGQGTGKHPHKSSAEPYPHTKEGGGKEGGGSGEERRGKSGPSGRESQASGGEAQGRGESGRGQGEGQRGGSGSDELKQREYKDAEGNVHHHTKTYMEQHKK